MSLSREQQNAERSRRRMELGTKAALAVEYIENEAIQEVEQIQNTLTACLSAEKIDKDKILALVSRESSIREFVKKVERRITQSSKE